MTSIGNLYTTQIPEYTEAADIIKAFNLYHYGTETVPTQDSQISISPPASIAGWIKKLSLDIANLQEGLSNVSTLTGTQNLNDIQSTALWLSAANPTIALNYPVAAVGHLNVVNKSNQTFQTYQTTGTLNNFYVRAGTTVAGATTWVPWVLLSKDGHTHDTRYYTKNQIDEKISSTALTSSRVPVTSSSGTIVASDITTTELNSLDGINPNFTIEQRLEDKSDETHLHDNRYYLRSDVADPQAAPEAGAIKMPRIFVQSTQPSGAQVNDLWFW
jgi:hypothetical protein